MERAVDWLFSHADDPMQEEGPPEAVAAAAPSGDDCVICNLFVGVGVCLSMCQRIAISAEMKCRQANTDERMAQDLHTPSCVTAQS